LTQLERISSSIKGLANLDYLESIQHFKWPPWKRAIPYEVQISQLPKEEEAIEHNNRIKALRGISHLAIYTDASVMEKGKGVGIAFISFFGTLYPSNLQSKGEGTINLGLDQLVYNGELEGITLATEFASQAAFPGLKIDIFSDNQAGLYRLKTPSDNPGQSHQIRVWKAAKAAKEKGANIALNWVPGHTDIVGNEKQTY
jgi:ribonuclease HI